MLQAKKFQEFVDNSPRMQKENAIIAQRYSGNSSNRLNDNIKSPSWDPDSTSGKNNLPPAIQAKMQNSFGHNFSDVNVFPNSDKPSAIDALAFTQGKDIHFAPGQYNPESQKGQELLGHELTHVVQQQQGRVNPTIQMKGVNVNDSPQLEKEADEMGRKAAKGESVKVNNSAEESIQRSENPIYGNSSFTHKVIKGESLNLIIDQYFNFNNLPEASIWDFKSQILMINNLIDESEIKEGDSILIPNLHIESKTDGNTIVHGNASIGKEESKDLNFNKANVLATRYFTTGAGAKVTRHAFSLTESDWKDLMKNGKLDNYNDYQFWAEGFIKLALGENLPEASKPGEDGWIIYRKPNIGEIISFMKALYHPDVDLMSDFHEYAEFSGTSMGTKTMLPDIGKFVQKYQGLLIELDARRNLNKGAKDRESIFSNDNIKKFGHQSYTGSGTKDVMNGALYSAYETLGKGIFYIKSSEKDGEYGKEQANSGTVDDIKSSIGGNMIETSLNIIRGILYEYDGHLNLQQSILQAGLNKIKIPYLPSDFQEIFVMNASTWIVLPNGHKNPKEKMRELINRIIKDLQDLENRHYLSKNSFSYISIFFNKCLGQLD